MQREIPDRVLELWRQYQTELAKHDITDHAIDARGRDLASDEDGARRPHVA